MQVHTSSQSTLSLDFNSLLQAHWEGTNPQSGLRAKPAYEGRANSSEVPIKVQPRGDLKRTISPICWGNKNLSFVSQRRLNTDIYFKLWPQISADSKLLAGKAATNTAVWVMKAHF
ncbi:hypothetical protein K474DRAFT_1658650 [Panus rudis PR-1116 ss-1]|nr:hypothetical protein K474DRAFT_1658650 [Panus rudis PR-1116 ss-1]